MLRSLNESRLGWRALGTGLCVALALSACDARVRDRNGGGPGDDGGGMPGYDLGIPMWTQTDLTVVAPGTPSDAPQRFGGAADPSRAPAIEYPPAGVMVPPNLNELEVQFDPNGNDLFEVSFVGQRINLRIYTTCTPVGSGCSLTPDENTWMSIAQLGRGDTLTLGVRGTQSAGGSVGSAATRTISFPNEDLLGGIYYWNASGTIQRYEFGRRGQRAENFYTPGQAGAICVGCHAVARNGSRIAVGTNQPSPAGVQVLDVATRHKTFSIGGSGFPGSGGSNFQAFTPDGSRLITSENNGLTIRDAASGNVIGGTPALTNGTMPDVSPDGTRVVFARGAGGLGGIFAGANPGVSQGGLWVAALGPASITNPVLLVAAPSGGAGNFYPSFSPDGLFVIYDHAEPAGSDADTSYDNPVAQVYAVPAGGGNPMNLAAINTAVGNSWPKAAPFIHHFQGSTIFWVTFSSTRPYGLHGGGNYQIWMAAIDASKLGQGQDGSYAPFWLPFQDFSTGNHIAQVVEKVERAPCSNIDNAGCMSNEQCEDGVCVPIIQ